ncbi:arginyl-tRNA synthetase [Streptomyces sp. SAI-135]|uniref:ArgS-related anticodon-binding protein NrtL n=1 Tax=unclassified Streptomyces TaxID=2593676 RepID=UPI002474B372|nr:MULTISPECIES: DALR anticodon-binding domain-containing protein [unclassified Streptomyces]MDH6516498.1 arginyl-tRNA synthetase [Streptomyces sp. SAI-090]MDH6548691.1 arginyl-tRNA synthetase [Streptomyces sp. SAI-041]MDH6619413.1 arginyl-tRNA synthetase [Streptomyces sp. SAI-135]
MTPVELSRTVLRVVRRAVDDGELDVPVPGRTDVAPPGPGGCGDYATNVALKLARPAGQPPLRVAEILRRRLAQSDGISDVVVTGPGFLNISLRRGSGDALVREILRLGQRYGHADRPTGKLVRLHAPHEVRAVVVMDAVARILRAQGAVVRTSCVAGPEPAWTDLLGVQVDAHGSPEANAPATAPATTPATAPATTPPDVNVRPVPAPATAVPAPATPATPLHVNTRPTPAPADPTPLGRDAARWALLHPAPHDRPRISADHLVQREGNPLFRVRYAYARTRALTRNAADLGFHAEPGDLNPPGADKAAAAVPDPTPLRNALADHPRILQAAAAHHAPDRLARHLVTVADAVLPLLAAVLPRGAEKPSAAHRARLALAEAAGAVLAGGLTLLGIDAPEHL